MITIKTKTALKNFSGEELKNGEKVLTIGEAISTVLAGQTSNPTLAWILGKKFACDKEVELKAEDVVFLKKEIEGSKHWTSIVSGQVLEILDAPQKK